MSGTDSGNVVTPDFGTNDSADNVKVSKADVEALRNEVANLHAEVQNIPTQVVSTLLAGKNLAGFPDDMGLPKEFQLGQPAQNYFVWSANMGATRALQSPENLFLIAVMLDAMSQAGADPVARMQAAQAALDNAKRTIHG
jgi:hypothetical protein